MASNLAALATYFGTSPEALHGFRTECIHPAHSGDGDANLSVRVAESGRYATLQCHSHGCKLSDPLRDLAGISATASKFDAGQWMVYDKPKAARGDLDATYPYVDESGEVLYYVKRYRDPKGFSQELPDGTPRLGSVRRVLYHLPAVLAASAAGRTVYVVEGEKDADRLGSLGEIATTCAQGAGKWQDDFSQTLRGAHVVIIADRDEKGYGHARKVAASVRPYAASVATVHTPLQRDKADVSDHLDAGHPLSALVPIDEVITPDELVGRDGIYTLKAVKAVESMGHIAKSTSGQLYAYENGLWKLCARKGELIRGRVAHLLGDKYRQFHGNTVVDAFQVRPAQFDDDRLDTQHINLANGLLDWRTGDLKPHTPDVFTLSQLPVSWDPDAECPTIDKWISETFPADAVDLVFEIAGYMLYNDNPLHKAVLLYGTGRNGKGTFLRLLRALVGAENSSSVTPQALDDNRFRAAELHGKLANLVGDVDPKIFKATEVFKQVTGGDSVLVERKHEHPFAFTCRALMVAAFNAFPRTEDTSMGFFERWVVLPFSGIFTGKRADSTLSDRLTAEPELEGFLVKAVAGLQRLMARGHFDVPETVRQATAEFRETADPLRRFLAERIVWEPTARTERGALSEAYWQWTDDEGHHPMAASTLYSRVKAAAVADTGNGLREAKSSGKRYFVGMRLRTDAELDSDD